MSVKSSTELMLYVVLTMPTLNKAYLFINDLDVILHGCMLQNNYTTVFLVKRLSNLKFRVRLLNGLTRKTVV
jgi:hypothetical protein